MFHLGSDCIEYSVTPTNTNEVKQFKVIGINVLADT